MIFSVVKSATVILKTFLSLVLLRGRTLSTWPFKATFDPPPLSHRGLTWFSVGHPSPLSRETPRCFSDFFLILQLHCGSFKKHSSKYLLYLGKIRASNQVQKIWKHQVVLNQIFLKFLSMDFATSCQYPRLNKRIFCTI